MTIMTKRSTPFPHFTQVEHAHSNEHRLSQVLPLVTSPTQLPGILGREQTLGAILSRSTPELALFKKYSCRHQLRDRGRSQALLVRGVQPTVLKSHFQSELLHIGVLPEDCPVLFDALVEDFVELVQLLAGLANTPQCISAIGSNWLDVRGVHIDIGESLALLVSYSFATTRCLDLSDVRVPRGGFKQGSVTDWQQLQVNSTAVPVAPRLGDVLLLKGYREPTDILPWRPGMPHVSPRPPIGDKHTKRLTLVAYAVPHKG